MGSVSDPASASTATASQAPTLAIGVVTKWVNYGKGWRKRVVVVEDGVLTYFTLNKVNLMLILETARNGTGTGPKKAKDVTWIGTEVQTLLAGQKRRYVQNEPMKHEAQGTVSLFVSSVRKSSESKKFYVDTGTSVLQFYASGSEERQQWLAVLGAHGSRSVPAGPSHRRSAAAAPAAGGSLADGRRGMSRTSSAGASGAPRSPSQRLFARLRSEHGVAPSAVEEVATHVRALQARLRSERRERKSLLTWLYTLQEEKRQLEEELIHSTLDSECIRQTLTDEELQTLISKMKMIDDKLNDEDDDDDDDEEEEEEDFADEDGEEIFYDAEEALPRHHSAGAPCGGRRLTANGSLIMPANALQYMESMPAPERRKTLPIPREPPRRLSLWGLLKEAVGKDLSRIALPVYFNEPISGIQKGCEDLEYSELLDAAAIAGKGSVERMAHVAAFCVSGYASTLGRTSKPFNPLLAETYEIHDVEKGLRFIGEKVCHHPTILAGFAEGRSWDIRVQSELKTKFWGAKIDLSFKGVPTIKFHDGEVFTYNKVTTSIHNIIIGKTYVDHHGTMTINSSAGTTCTLKFCPTGMLTKVPHQVKGSIRRAPKPDRASSSNTGTDGPDDDESTAQMSSADDGEEGGGNGGAGALEETPVFGTWSSSLSCNLSGEEGRETLLWEKTPPTEEVQRYPNWGYFQAQLNEHLPCMDPLCPTDSRLRPDQRQAENGDWDDANESKLRLEDKQRAARKAAKDSGEKLTPRWFEEGADGVYRYVGGYWESKFNGGTFESCRDIF